MSCGVVKRDIVVNADNEFNLLGRTFKIPESNKKYKVMKKYDDVEDYENESFMENVDVGLGVDLKLEFYDEDGEKIQGVVLK